MEGWTVNGHSYYKETQKGVSFHVIFSIWVIIWGGKWLSFPLLWPHATIGTCFDIIMTLTQHSRHPQEGAVKVWKQSDWQFQRYTHFCTPPVFLIWEPSVFLNYVSTNVISIYACHTCPLSSPCQCATPHIWLECSWPDARVLPVQLPAWYLVLASQDQGWGMPGLPTLHPGQGRLCSSGPLGSTWWRSQMRSREIPWLHQKHLRWQDLPTSPHLWTVGCQEEVWQICWWTHR